MKRFLFLAFAVLAAKAATDEEQWAQFKIEHGRSYRSMREEQLRFRIFRSNLRTIETHNARYGAGEESYFLKVTQFADMSPEEFHAMLTLQRERMPEMVGEPLPEDGQVAAPASVDWRQKGAVLGVKNQGQCGSCWAFSTTGCLEGQNAIKHGKKVSLSEQNLMDCSSSYGNNDCGGGLMDNAFRYVKDHGIESEAAYPYKGYKTSCRFTQSKSVLKLKNYYNVRDDENSLRDAVAAKGPISVAIDASSLAMYGGGVYNPRSCSSTQLNHGVLAVGYGTDSGSDYWIVKNSWGAGWGENGYVRMVRNNQNKCGIATMASYAEIQ